MNESEMEEMKTKLDMIMIGNSLNTVHLSVLTQTVFELSAHLLNKEEATNLKTQFLGTLRSESNPLSVDSDLLYNPSRLTSALFDLHEYIEYSLKNL